MPRFATHDREQYLKFCFRWWQKRGYPPSPDLYEKFLPKMFPGSKKLSYDQVKIDIYGLKEMGDMVPGNRYTDHNYALSAQGIRTLISLGGATPEEVKETINKTEARYFYARRPSEQTTSSGSDSSSETDPQGSNGTDDETGRTSGNSVEDGSLVGSAND